MKSEHSTFTLGQQAHIVGEKEDAARGKSPLTDEERNSYHNLILLCPNDHAEIDQNEADWPVEKLHLIKSQHELWVRETLGDSADTKLLAKQVAVTAIIDATVKLCDLEHWKHWASDALAPDPQWDVNMPDNLFEFRQRVAAAIWPEGFEELRRATETLAVLLHEAAIKFMEHSQNIDGRLLPDKFYRTVVFNSNYDQDGRYNKWLQECWELMTQASCAANWFADVVRRDINPMFFAERGKFVVLKGPFPDLSIRFSIPEFSEEQKAGLPESLQTNPE